MTTRVHRGELTSAVAALLLLILMFATEWYGVAGVVDPSAAKPAASNAENAWNGLTDLRWLMLLTILVTLGSVALHASQRRHGTRTDTSWAVLVLGSITAVLLAYRVLIQLPQPDRVLDQKLGAVLGLICALAIAGGGLESVTDRRLRVAAEPEPARRRRPVAAGGPER